MKEIDLLPEWYKSSKRRQVSYRAQYIGVCVLVLIMLMWNFLAVHSVSTAEADLSELEIKKVSVKNVFDKAVQIKHELERIKEKSDVLENINPKINISDVLAEMSCLLNSNVVLNRFDVLAESFDNNNKVLNHSNAVRTANSRQVNNTSIHYGDVKFRITLGGVASNASDVAELICSLEDSEYFFKVIPSFSRNKQLRTGKKFNGEEYDVSEFEISCYLANYRINEKKAANAVKIQVY
ncbi:MAG: PilN domain-containing protein [Planctomycetota bacterium]|jgi:hypothetical protein